MSSLFFIFFVIPLLTIEGQRCQAFFAFQQFVVFSYLHLKEEGKTGDIWQHTIVINSSEILNQNYGQIIVASNITYIFKCSEKLFSYRVLTNHSCNPYSHSSEYTVGWKIVQHTAWCRHLSTLFNILYMYNLASCRHLSTTPHVHNLHSSRRLRHLVSKHCLFMTESATCTRMQR